MVDQASETLFLQDNLLSEDDWGGGINFEDLNDFTSSDQSSPCDDFYLGEEAKYEEEYTSQVQSFEENGSPGIENPSPLLSPSNDCNFVDELLQDLLQPKNQNVTDDALLQRSSLTHLEKRRLSTHTSSSSAYSSCSDSGTPSPADQFSDHGSCSSVEFQDQTTLTIDLTSVSDSDMCPEKFTRQTSQQSSSLELGMKSRRYKRAASLSKDLMKATELEKAVRQACEETNRLLKLHKQLSGKAEAEITSSEKNKPQATQDQDILKSLCDETILNKSKHTSCTDRTQLSTTLKKPPKRKASTLQDAIDRLQSANKSPCLGTSGLNHPTPFSRSAIVSNPTRSKPLQKPVQLDSKTKEPCIIVTSTQPPQQSITLDNVTLNGTQSYTLTPTPSSGGHPVQFYIKQEPPTVQPCQVVGNVYQQPTMQNVVPMSNQKVVVSNGHSTNLSLNTSGVSVCNNGQTIVIQQPPQNHSSQSILKPVNISEMKPGTQPMVITQSDLSRLAAQGVIKFPSTRKSERCLVPVSEESRVHAKNDAKQVTPLSKSQAVFPTVCDVLPADAVGVINGTSVFVNGFDNNPQRGELDIKALKRHQRMIKNRASACESRQRRKEYLKTLEDQVTEVAEENKILREKNEFLSSRVHELEIENKNLRELLGVRQSQQRKTTCVLALMLFIGVNFFPIGLFGNNTSPLQSGSKPFEASYHNTGLKPAISQESVHHPGRHLLSVVEEQSDVAASNESKRNSDDKALIVPEKQKYWMDDFVRQYRDKHLKNFLQLLSETTSNSVKRMLRRKLKEELGITVPMPVPRSRRIAYTPQSGRQRMAKMSQDSKPSTQKENAITSSTPNVEKIEVKVPSALPQPCEQPNLDESALNETEASRVNEDITQWAKRYTVERQEEAQKSAEKKKRVSRKLRNTKSPSSRYEDHDNTTELAIYARPSKTYDKFLETIKRKNDTLYVVTLNKDHLLLPATVRNTSSRMKMALVMPAVTSNDRQSHTEYETMIEIECEVLNTRMFELKRTDVPDFLDIGPVKGTVKTLDTASNDTMSQSSKSAHPVKTSPIKQRQNDYRLDETEKQDDEQDAVVAVVSDATEPEIYKTPLT